MTDSAIPIRAGAGYPHPAAIAVPPRAAPTLLAMFAGDCPNGRAHQLRARRHRDQPRLQRRHEEQAGRPHPEGA